MKSIVHWCQPKKMWTHHTYNSCMKNPYILIKGGWSTEVKPKRKTNPRGWVVTQHNQVSVPNQAEVQKLLKKIHPSNKLLYDKNTMSFNISSGETIIFTPEGAFVI